VNPIEFFGLVSWAVIAALSIITVVL